MTAISDTNSAQDPDDQSQQDGRTDTQPRTTASDDTGPDRTICDHRVGRFIDAITLGASIPEAGAIVNLGRSQSYEWAKSPAVRHELALRRAEMRRAIVEHIADAAFIAIANLQSIMANPAHKEMDRIRAAKLILDTALGGWEWSLHEDIVELTDRVRAAAA